MPTFERRKNFQKDSSKNNSILPKSNKKEIKKKSKQDRWRRVGEEKKGKYEMEVEKR